MPLHAAFIISHRVLPLVCRDVDVLCCHLLGRETSEKCLRGIQECTCLGSDHVKAILLVFSVTCVPPVRLMLDVEILNMSFFSGRGRKLDK